MAGSVKLDFVDGGWYIKLFDSKDKIVDVYEVAENKMYISLNAYKQLYELKRGRNDKTKRSDTI